MIEVLAYQREKLVPDSYETGSRYLSRTARLDGLHGGLDDVLLGRNVCYDLDSIDSSLETDASHDEHGHAHEGKEAHGHGGQCCPHGPGTVTAQQHSSGQHSHGDTATASSSHTHEGHDHALAPDGLTVSSAQTSDMENYKGCIDACVETAYDAGLGAVSYKIIDGAQTVTYLFDLATKSRDYSDRRFDKREQTSTAQESHSHGSSEPKPLEADAHRATTRNQDWGRAIVVDTKEC